MSVRMEAGESSVGVAGVGGCRARVGGRGGPVDIVTFLLKRRCSKRGENPSRRYGYYYPDKFFFLVFFFSWSLIF